MIMVIILSQTKKRCGYETQKYPVLWTLVTLPYFSVFFSCVIYVLLTSYLSTFGFFPLFVSPLLWNVLFLLFSSHCFHFLLFPLIYLLLFCSHISFTLFHRHISILISCIPMKTHLISTLCTSSGELLKKRREEKVDKRKTSESCEQKERMKDSEETLYRDFSFSVYVHVIVVRRRPGCAVSSWQAVIGWNIHL